MRPVFSFTSAPRCSRTASRTSQMCVISQSGSAMKLFITELPRPRTPMQATPILPFGFAAITEGAVDAAAAAVTAAPVVFRKDRRVVEMGLMVVGKVCVGDLGIIAKEKRFFGSPAGSCARFGPEVPNHWLRSVQDHPMKTFKPADRTFSPLRLVAVVVVLIVAVTVSAHDLTHAAHQSSLAPGEAPLLAAAPSLREATKAAPSAAPTCRLSLEIIDAETHARMPGLVRVTRADGSLVLLEGLVNRGLKLRIAHPAKQWFVMVDPAVVTVPREVLQVEAIGSLETERVSQTIDLTGKEAGLVTLALRRFENPARTGWRAGNTHLHLSGLTRAMADEYLQTIPRADGLELVFVSFLSRTNADKDYISNTYTRDQLRALSSGVEFGWGEEHRHNFGPSGEGFGHVMLLNLLRLTEPVSIGPGIMGAEHDFPPLRHGIDSARRDGATVIWCHNAFGFEDIPNWLTGRVQAHNIFDGGNHGSYADTYYRFLNVGLKVPFSTGTDWFIYDFARVYARMNEPLTERSWLAALEAGRTFITNGPLLTLRAGEHEIGDTIKFDQAGELAIAGRATGRADFRRIEIVHNGAVIQGAPSRAKDGHFEANLDFRLKVTEPGWIALRVATGSDDLNEMGEPIFGHTSPIYVDYAGQKLFRFDAAQSMITSLETGLRSIEAAAKFANDSQRDEVRKIYREAIDSLRNRLGR